MPWGVHGGVPGGGVAGGASLARGGSRSHLSGREVALSLNGSGSYSFFEWARSGHEKNLKMYLLHPQIFFVAAAAKFEAWRAVAHIARRSHTSRTHRAHIARTSRTDASVRDVCAMCARCAREVCDVRARA